MLRKILRHMFCQPRMVRRTIVLLLSVTIMGTCVAVFDRIGFGTDPSSVMNLGASRKLGIQFGTYQVLFNTFLLLIILACRQWKVIGIGSIANMVIVGYAKDLFDVIFDALNILQPDSLTMAVRICWLVPTLAVFMIVVSFYMIVELGTAPYDAIPQIISKYVKKVPFAVIRMLYDITALSIGYLLGSTVGVVTLVTGFCLGPIIGVISKKFRPFFIEEEPKTC
jgi:uncharacterized protein